jgi:hypothetical protein
MGRVYRQSEILSEGQGGTYRITDIGTFDDSLTEHYSIILITRLPLCSQTSSEVFQSSNPGEMETHIGREYRRVQDLSEPLRFERYILGRFRTGKETESVFTQ